MNLKTLELKHFRSYSDKTVEFSKNSNVILGDNGVGKTNLLEAVYLLTRGKSFRAKTDSEMILYGAELARISGQTGTDNLEVVITHGLIAGQAAPKKRYLVNNAPKRLMDFMGKLTAVLFRPEDIDLVLGSPSRRREYWDSVLEPADKDYRRCNLSYKKGLRQRNRLLELMREGRAARKQLLFWDELLIKNGDVISRKREEFLGRVNREFKRKKLDLFLEYDKNAISSERLERYGREEVLAAKTLVGPHRDEFHFFRQRRGKVKKDLSVFGSRGEQRLAVFNLKLAELEFIETILGEAPLLLLDDIFSELDHDNREEVLRLLDKQQTIITTSDEHLIPKKYASIHRLTLK